MAKKILDARTNGRRSDEQLLVGFAGHFVSMITLGPDIIWIGVDRSKQGWRYKFALTIVVSGKRGTVK